MSFRVTRGTVLTVAFATAWLAAGAARSAGPVVGWGYNLDGHATPPPSVDGTAGTAMAISAGGGDTLAIVAPELATALVSAASLGSLLALAPRRRLGLPAHFTSRTTLRRVAVLRWGLPRLTASGSLLEAVSPREPERRR